MDTNEKLDLILAKLDKMEERFQMLTAGGTLPVGGEDGPLLGHYTPPDPARIETVYAALRGALGEDAPMPRPEQVMQWLGFGYTAEQIAEMATAYIEPARAEALGMVAPGEDWRSMAAHLVAIKGHDAFRSLVHPISGAPAEGYVRGQGGRGRR